METPVLSYQAAEQELNPKPLSQIVSQEVTTQNEVLSWLNDHDSYRGKYSMSDKQKEKVRGYFPNIEELAAPKICKFIDGLESTSGECDRYKNTIKTNIEQSVKSSCFGEKIINFYDIIRDQLMNEDYRQSRVRQRQKFSGLNKEEIVDRIQLFSDYISAEKIVIEPISKTRHTYTISCC
jgi:hypothetical protein